MKNSSRSRIDGSIDGSSDPENFPVYKRSDFIDAGARIRALPPEEYAIIRAGADEILAQVHLAKIRKALKQTQKDVSTAGGLKQAEISRIERNPETVQVRTLERYVKSLGGELQLVARFPDGTAAEIPMRAGKPVQSRVKMTTGGPRSKGRDEAA